MADDLEGRREPKPTASAGWVRALTGNLGTVLALLGVILLFALADWLVSGPQASFATVRNLRVVLASTSIVAVAALGMTIIIIAGGIDLSAGTALTLCATVMAYGLKADWGVLLTVPLTLVTGIACGLANGLLVSSLRIVPFIVTLGTMTVFVGCGKLVADQSTISPSRDQIPTWVQNLCSTRPPDVHLGFLPNLPLGVWITLILAVLVASLLRYSVFGRYVFALGSNEPTARLCGVNIPVLKTLVYALAGIFVAVGGIYHFGLLKMSNPVEGLGLELKIIAAVVIGGGSLSGGRGSVLGTLAGAMIMGVITSGCDQLAVPTPYQDMTIGVIIIVAVTLDQLRQRRLERAR
jgi:ribose/xylose/arabinose/galactoside ABC-type transport system permease subunit